MTAHMSAEERARKLEQVFDIHDLLINDLTTDLTFTNIVSLGRQSAGKTTVLSAIANVPLWSDGKRATVCPSQIHSRYRPTQTFMSRIEIEIADPLAHTPRRLPFTSAPLTDPAVIADAMRMALYQAKEYARGNGCAIRTYDDIAKWTPEQLEEWYKAPSLAQPPFSDNVVVLHVCGPAQPNLSIIDMPGITGDPLTLSMVQAEIRKPENLILCCAPGVGTNLTPLDPEFDLVKKHDPLMKRSFVVVTRADQIEDPSSFEEQLNPNMKTWETQPAHGWWFTSSKTNEENRRKTHESVIRLREQALFADPKWDCLRGFTGFHCGTSALCYGLHALFQSMVLSHVKSLTQTLKDRQQSTEASLALLPAEIDEPREMVHGLIGKLSSTISTALQSTRDHTMKPFILQHDLHLELMKKIPVFLPFDQAQERDKMTYRSASLKEWTPAKDAEKVYLDQVLELVQRNMSARDSLFEARLCRGHYVSAYAGHWKALCEEHVREMWRITRESIATLSDEALAIHPTLASRVKHVLFEASEKYEKQTLDLVQIYCKRETEDPNDIDIPTFCRDDRAKLMKHYRTSCPNLQQQQSTPDAPTTPITAKRQPPSPGSEPDVVQTNPGAPPLSPVPHRSATPDSHVQVSLELNWCFRIMASTTVHLADGALRVASLVRRETQAQVRDFVKDISSILRKEMGLNRLGMDVQRTLAGLLEPDEGVVVQRENLKKRKREYEEISKRFHQRLV